MKRSLLRPIALVNRAILGKEIRNEIEMTVRSSSVKGRANGAEVQGERLEVGQARPIAELVGDLRERQILARGGRDGGRSKS